MLEDPGANSARPSFISSLRDDVWHGRAGRHSFERWHFDALSDDGREALIISFYDNYPFSPRYFKSSPVADDDANAGHYPAVTFLYAVDGRIVMQAVNEWSVDHFSAMTDNVKCSIGESYFRVEKANYGSGYMVHIEAMTPRKRQIVADVEWLSIESDLLVDPKGAESPSMAWNLVAPRSDVSGRITRTGVGGRSKKVVHFRGTGYHDHFQSRHSRLETVGRRCWGRAHFADTTAVFQYLEHDTEGDESGRIVLIQDGSIIGRDARFTISGQNLDRKGREAEFDGGEHCKINIRSISPIQRGFFERRMLSEVTLTLPDGKARTTEGIVEYCNPKGMQNPVYRWMADLRIGRNGNSGYF